MSQFQLPKGHLLYLQISTFFNAWSTCYPSDFHIYLSEVEQLMFFIIYIYLLSSFTYIYAQLIHKKCIGRFIIDMLLDGFYNLKKNPTNKTQKKYFYISASGF